MTLHGLKLNDITICREEIEHSMVMASRKYSVTRYQLLYLRKQCQSTIHELQKTCHEFSLPPAERESNHAYILVTGKSSDVDDVCKKLDEIIGTDKFKVEIFTTKCLQCLSSLWEEIWSTSKQAREMQQNVCIQFASSKMVKFLTEPEQYNVVNFEVFGERNHVDLIWW